MNDRLDRLNKRYKNAFDMDVRLGYHDGDFESFIDAMYADHIALQAYYGIAPVSREEWEANI